MFSSTLCFQFVVLCQSSNSLFCPGSISLFALLSVIACGVIFRLDRGDFAATEAIPRPKRHRRRAKSDRGLPPDDQLGSLAKDYLDKQRKSWPEIAQSGLLPEPTPDVISSMVEDFKDRHRGAVVTPIAVEPFFKYCSKLGGNYDRFSCDNSSPTSINDQMLNSLDKAKAEELFVPWLFVYADFSVSGLDASRQGYNSYKQVVSEHERLVCTFIDDFTRASRDEIEWWKLATFHKRLKKGMFGASDGFDLNSLDWDVKVTLAGLISRLFLRSLRQKVRRGMQGSARRGTVIGKLPLGFTRRILCDGKGQIVLRPNGLPKHVPCFDPATVEYRKMKFDLFIDENLSVSKIRKRFNELRVDGWNGWTDSAIRNLLWSPTAIGIFIHNQTRREFDFDEEKWITVKNPPSEWQIFHDPSLAIVSLEKWKKARRKIAASRRSSPRTGKPLSRNEKCATTLVSGTLFCDYCDREITLNRSAGRYKVLACPNGSKRVHDCELTSSKSTRHVETSILEFLREHLCTVANVDNLLNLANKHLEELSRKPQIKTSPIKAEIRKLNAAVDELVERVESKKDDKLRDAYDRRISKHQQRIEELRSTLRDAESKNAKPLCKLDRKRVAAYVADMRSLLNQDSIPAAANAIRAITGPIRVRQEIVPGKRGARWIGVFSPDLLRLLKQIARDKDYPDRITLEYLNGTNWIMETPYQIVLETPKKYEIQAHEMKRLFDKGASIATLAHLFRCSGNQVVQIIRFAETGEKPLFKSGKDNRRSQGNRRSSPKIERYKDLVARLRDRKKLSFIQVVGYIQREHQETISYDTVVRAYDRAHPELLKNAAEQGKSPDRGSQRGLGEVKHRQIRRLLSKGVPRQQIATQLDIGKSTVYREWERMRNEEACRCL